MSEKVNEYCSIFVEQTNTEINDDNGTYINERVEKIIMLSDEPTPVTKKQKIENDKETKDDTKTTWENFTVNLETPMMEYDKELKEDTRTELENATINTETQTTEDDKETKEDLKIGWENHTMNISGCLEDEDAGDFLSTVSTSDVSIFHGIGPLSSRVLDELHVKTIEDLANWKYFLIARALTTLAELEIKSIRPTGSTMNVDNAVTVPWRTRSLKEIVQSPTSALKGISKEACELLEILGVTTIQDLATFKYCCWAEAIVEASKYECTLTIKERKVEGQLKKLDGMFDL